MTSSPQDNSKHRDVVSNVRTALIAVVASILLVYFLRSTYTVTMPIAASAFVAMIVHPVYTWLSRKLPRKLKGAAAPISLLLVLCAVLIFVGSLTLAGGMIARKAPEYAGPVQSLYAEVSGWATSRGVPVENLDISRLQERLFGLLTVGVGTVGSLLSGTVLILFFVLLILIESPQWQERIRESVQWKVARATLATVETVSTRVRGYLWLRTILGAVTAALEGVWLYFIGVDLALVWAMLFFFLNFIPTIGSIVAAVPPAMVALLTLGPGRGMIAIAGMLVIEQVMGNFVEPKVVGEKLSISPFVSLVAVVFWGWVWGIPGALLAVPMTATLIIAFSHTEALEPLALLLSTENNEPNKR